ncbi:hypothetical protein EV360DRAFT_71201 [Lentinula raphanica]|nr:hypothetical protein EV360DRAFT_71201 [Lentinula raphanica]
MFDAFEVCQFLKQHRKKSQPDGLRARPVKRLVQKRGLTDEQNKTSSSTAGRVNSSNPLILFPNLKTPSKLTRQQASIEPQKPKVTKLSIAFSEQKPSTMQDGTGASSKRQSIRISGKSSPQSKNDGVIEDIVYSKFMRKIIKEQFELDLQESKLEISGTPVRSIDNRYHFDVALSLNMPIQEWKGRAAGDRWTYMALSTMVEKQRRPHRHSIPCFPDLDCSTVLLLDCDTVEGTVREDSDLIIGRTSCVLNQPKDDLHSNVRDERINRSIGEGTELDSAASSESTEDDDDVQTEDKSEKASDEPTEKTASVSDFTGDINLILRLCMRDKKDNKTTDRTRTRVSTGKHGGRE